MQMQGTPAAAVTPKSGNIANLATGAGSDAIAAGEVDFSALLLAHIKGGAVASGGVEADLGAEAEQPEVLVSPDAQFQPGFDPLLNGLLPPAGILVPVQIDLVSKPPTLESASPVSSIKVQESGRSIAGMLPIETESPEVATAPIVPKQAAEFAVDGKVLPQDDVEKLVEMPSFPVQSAVQQQMEEVASNAMPVMPAPVSPASAMEVKAAPVVATVSVPVGGANWGEALGQKVIWMTGQQTHVAELRLDPPHLGPMEVRLTVSNDQVSAIFVSHQPAVREAIEAAMPRLREMFAESGMLLGDAMVSSDSLPQQQSPGRERQSGSSLPFAPGGVDGGAHSWSSGGTISLSGDGRGMVDLFA